MQSDWSAAIEAVEAKRRRNGEAQSPKILFPVASGLPYSPSRTGMGDHWNLSETKRFPPPQTDEVNRILASFGPSFNHIRVGLGDIAPQASSPVVMGALNNPACTPGNIGVSFLAESPTSTNPSPYQPTPTSAGIMHLPPPRNDQEASNVSGNCSHPIALDLLSPVLNDAT